MGGAKHSQAFFKLPRDEQIALLVAEMQRLADGDKAPSETRWNAQRRRDLPVASTIRLSLVKWDTIVQRAGLHRPGKGTKPGQHSAGTFDRNLVAIGGENDATIARHRDGRNSWPLLGVVRRREVVAEVTLAPGVVQQTIREYIGLR
jgi:hypothetical protein